MHLRGCYDWFRRPPTEYEKWREQHDRNKARREAKEAKRQKKDEEKLKRYREEMERRREEIRSQGLSKSGRMLKGLSHEFRTGLKWYHLKVLAIEMDLAKKGLI
jgi:hypothetical protein